MELKIRFFKGKMRICFPSEKERGEIYKALEKKLSKVTVKNGIQEYKNFLYIDFKIVTCKEIGEIFLLLEEKCCQ